MPTWTGLGLNNNWNNNANWDTVAPTSTTTALFTGAGVSGSKDCTITAGAACSLLSCSAYLGTMSLANTLTVVGNLTLNSGMAITGSGGISKTGNGTLISNGVTLDAPLTLNGGGGTAHTLGSNWTINGTISQNLNTQTITGGGFTASLGGGLTIGALAANNVTFLLRGTGTLSGNYTGNTFAGSTILISSSAGTITQSALSLSTCTFTYVTGGYISTGIVNNGGLGVVYNNVSGITFNSLAFLAAGGQAITLNSNMNISGGLAVNAFVAGAINGAFTVFVGGNITPTHGLTGTATIEMSGSANASIAAGSIQNNLTINKSGGATVTFPAGGTITWGAAGRTLTYTAGTIVPSTSTFAIPNNTSVTINGMNFWNLTIPGASTTTQNTLNTIQNNLTLGSTGNTAFTGSAGWTCANLICTTAGRTITLGNSGSGASYRTTTNASLPAGTAASRITMTSDNATTRSLWTLDYGAQQQLIYTNGTRIDSSQGQTIWSFGAALTNTVNWATGSRPGTIGYTFVI